MNIKRNDVFVLSGYKYIVLEETEYKNIKYIFVNKLDKLEEPTKEFLVFKCLENGLIIEKDKEILNYVLKYFSEKANENLELILDIYSNSGDNNERK